MHRSFRFLIMALFCGISLTAGFVLAGAPAKPNILLIVADDLGWADVGYHGANIETPAIDRLAQEGVQLDQYYVHPECTPTRVSLLTGRYPSRFGPHPRAASNLRALDPGTLTLASLLKSMGYTTYVTGKWHLGSRPEWGPNHFGFDESYGSLAGAVDPWTHQYRPGPYARSWHRNEKLLDEQGNATELVAKQAVAWIRQKRAPWFIYVPFQAVHIPIDAPDEYKRRYADREFYDDPVKNESKKRFAAFVTQMDAKIGQMIAALEETGQRANTLIVFFSDNGGLWAGKNPYVGNVPDSPVISSNRPLRGQKAQLYEGGIRVVALAHWPGRLTARKATAPMHATDWMPTLARLAGYAPTTDPKWDGHDVWPLLTGQVAMAEPRTIYIPHRKSNSALRHGDWKLITHRRGKHELYNLAKDPYEKKNLAEKMPDRVEALKKILKTVRRDDVDRLPNDLRGHTP